MPANIDTLDWTSAIAAIAQGLTAVAGFVLSWVIWKGTNPLGLVLLK